MRGTPGQPFAMCPQSPGYETHMGILRYYFKSLKAVRYELKHKQPILRLDLNRSNAVLRV